MFNEGLSAAVKPFLLSIVLHVVIAVMLLFSLKFHTEPPKPIKPQVNIVKAAAVNKADVEKELKRLADQEQAKKDAELKKQRELERKAEEAKQKRIEEERKLKEIEKKKQLEIKKQKEAEQKRKELEKQKQIELEKKKKAKEEAKKKKLEAEKKKKEEAERKRKEEEERKRKRLEGEKALQEQLEAEQQAAQEQQDLTEIQKYTILIGRAIESKFNRLGLPDGLSCEILISLLEGGKVVHVVIVKSSGNELFDKRAESAVYASSPLPVPTEVRVFNKMRTIQILFRPKS